MSDGKVIFSTSVDPAGLKRGLMGLSGSIAKFAQGAGIAIGLGAVALGGFTKKIIAVGGEFDTAMSQVAATMGTSVDKITMLENLAKKSGRETKFTATQSAEALNFLALAGYDAEKAAAALPTVLRLAAAGSMDLAYASDLVTDSMASLGLDVGYLDTFADQLAKTASKSNTSVAQLGEGILTVGGTAKLMKGGTAEIATALGILADNGIKGSEGGTMLRNILMTLTSPTEKASKGLKKLGIDVFDAQGNIRGINEVFADMYVAMDGMSDKERQASMGSIFRRYDLKGAEALMANSGVRFTSLMNDITHSVGAAMDMESTMLDNLEGDQTIMRSAGEGLMLAFYDGIEMPLRKTTQFATGVLGDMTTAFEKKGMTGVSEVFGKALGEGLTNVTKELPDIMEVVVEGATGLLVELFNNADEVVGAGAMLVFGIAEGVLSALPALGSALFTGIGNLFTNADEIEDAIEANTKKASAAYEKFVNGVKDNNTAMQVAFDDIAVDMGIANELVKLYGELEGIDPAIRTTDQVTQMQTVVQSLVDLYPTLQEYIDPITGLFAEPIGAIDGLIDGMHRLAIVEAYQEAKGKKLNDMVISEMQLDTNEESIAKKEQQLERLKAYETKIKQYDRLINGYNFGDDGRSITFESTEQGEYIKSLFDGYSAFFDGFAAYDKSTASWRMRDGIDPTSLMDALDLVHGDQLTSTQEAIAVAQGEVDTLKGLNADLIAEVDTLKAEVKYLTNKEIELMNQDDDIFSKSQQVSELLGKKEHQKQLSEASEVYGFELPKAPTDNTNLEAHILYLEQVKALAEKAASVRALFSQEGIELELPTVTAPKLPTAVEVDKEAASQGLQDIGVALDELDGDTATVTIDADEDVITKTGEIQAKLKSITGRVYTVVVRTMHIGGFTTSPRSKATSHSTGLNYVPYNDYLANLHKGEAVLTKAEADKWRNSRNLGAMVRGRLSRDLQANTSFMANNQGVSGGGGQVVNQTNHFNVPTQTPDEFAQTMFMHATYGLEG